MNRTKPFIPPLPSQRSSEDIVFERDKLTSKDFKRIIRVIGLKVTNQRIAILQTLHTDKQHMTTQEVHEIVHEKYPEIGFATVYRFMKKLKDSGIVNELRMGNLPTRYELTPDQHHDHITCLKCGKIVEFEHPVIEKLQEEIAKKLRFRLKSHVLELYGDCEHCYNPIRP